VAVWTRQSVYAYVSPAIRPGDALQVFAFDDDYSFGILHSTYHRAYFEERASKMRVDLRYTPRTVFDSFPWPQAPSEQAVERVVEVVERLIKFRDERLAEGITLGQQYDSLNDPGRNPLRDLQAELDDAVADVYGFDSEEDPLAQLLALNESMAQEEHERLIQPRGPGNAGLINTKRTTSMIQPALRLIQPRVADVAHSTVHQSTHQSPSAGVTERRETAYSGDGASRTRTGDLLGAIYPKAFAVVRHRSPFGSRARFFGCSDRRHSPPFVAST
jgi:hypothetical protein